MPCFTFFKKFRSDETKRLLRELDKWKNILIQLQEEQCNAKAPFIQKLPHDLVDNNQIAPLVNNFLAPIIKLKRLIEKIDIIHDELFLNHRNMRLLLAECDITFKSIIGPKNALSLLKEKEEGEEKSNSLKPLSRSH